MQFAGQGGRLAGRQLAVRSGDSQKRSFTAVEASAFQDELSQVLNDE